MGKVVTSQGLQEFISSGKVEEIKSEPRAAKPPTEAPPLEVKAEPVVTDIGGSEPQVKADEVHVDEDPETQAEIGKSERFRKTINKKHKAMREAQEAASEAERFAENQYNRARLAEQRAVELENQLKQVPAKVEPKPEEVKPDPKAFYDDQGQFKAFDYAEALSKFAATEAVAADRARQETERRAVETAEAERIARGRVEAVRKQHPDYDTVVQGADVKTHNMVLQYMTASEHVGDIAYYLAKNPEYVERINKLHPLKAVAEIGKLEQTFEKPAVVKDPPQVTPRSNGAPPPITPLDTSGSGTINVDPARMSYRELRVFERERQKRK